MYLKTAFKELEHITQHEFLILVWQKFLHKFCPFTLLILLRLNPCVKWDILKYLLKKRKIIVVSFESHG